jgi:zona occludens toxin
MLILVTGSPGAGKTSNMLWEFLKNPEYVNRPKFCSDIPDLDKSAHGLGDFTDIEKWQDMPDGSLVFIDEAQRFLRPRSGRVVPDWLAAFETHRHRGFDFIAITQHPSLIDTHFRRLVGRHYHFHKPFGIKNSIRYRWETIQENPSAHTFKDAQRKVIRTNPEVFKLYKSTVIDTHKRELPWGKLLLGLLGLFLVAGGLLYPFLHYSSSEKPETVKTSSSPTSASDTSKPLVAFESPVSGEERKVFQPTDLLPRADNLPWSAPYYDELTRPSDFPRIAACIDSTAKGCNCYTQQATPLSVDFKTCQAIVKNGSFDNWQSQRKRDDMQSFLPSPQTSQVDAPKNEGRNLASRSVM